MLCFAGNSNSNIIYHTFVCTEPLSSIGMNHNSGAVVGNSTAEQMLIKLNYNSVYI